MERILMYLSIILLVSVLHIYYTKICNLTFTKEHLDNPPSQNPSTSSTPQNPSDNSNLNICDTNCTLAPINTQISTIMLRLDSLDAYNKTQDTKIDNNASDIATIQTGLKKMGNVSVSSKTPPKMT